MSAKGCCPREQPPGSRGSGVPCLAFSFHASFNGDVWVNRLERGSGCLWMPYQISLVDFYADPD